MASKIKIVINKRGYHQTHMKYKSIIHRSLSMVLYGVLKEGVGANLFFEYKIIYSRYFNNLERTYHVNQGFINMNIERNNSVFRRNRL